MTPETPPTITRCAGRASSGSTRRALLAILPTMLVEPRTRNTVRSDEVREPVGSHPISFERRWADLLEAIHAQEVAVAYHDELERHLIARVAQHGTVVANDADLRWRTDDRSIAGCFITLGSAARKVEQSVAERMSLWNHVAEHLGLPAAVDEEARAASSVRHAASDLIGQPATKLAHVRLKLATLIAVHEPGRGCRDETPWRELRLILSDTERLLDGASI